MNDILTINEREILEHAGTISHQMAVEIAENEFDKYRKEQQLKEKQDSMKELEADLLNFSKVKRLKWVTNQ